MKPRYQVSKAAIKLIKGFEGYRRASAVLSNGRYTIGYGHTKSARADVEIPERDAEALLIYDLLDVTGAINDLVFTPLTQNQFDALVSFAFNIGVENFRRSSVLRRINEGNLIQAATAIEMWRKSEFEGERIVIDALVRRRAAEKALFLTPMDGWVPAPTPVLPPKPDYDPGALNGPQEEAVRMIAPLEGPVAAAHPERTELIIQAADADSSPVTIAAESVTARLRALELEDAAPESELEPHEAAEAEVEPEAPSEVEAEPEAETASGADDPLEEALKSLANDAPEADFALTAPEPHDAPYEVEAEEIEHRSEEPESAPLPFDEPSAEEPEDTDELTSVAEAEAEAPLTLGALSRVHRIGRREPTAYIAEDTFPKFHSDAEPMQFHLMPLVGLFLGGLALVAFAIVWGANTDGQGASVGPLAISWISGIIGIAAMVAAFYLFVTRLGGSED